MKTVAIEYAYPTTTDTDCMRMYGFIDDEETGPDNYAMMLDTIEGLQK